ncbi:MAG: tetratricopeptide repeat protein [Planctomycetes bacterium]|nr:tetratricopeptide repeat protein [Planctomycetota bacterium]
MIYVPDAEAELALDRTIAFCRRLWSDGDEEPDALRTIVATQSLSWDTYHIVELAAFEAVLRIKRGEPFDAQTFADRFGDCAAEIYERCRVSQLFHLQFHGRPLLDSVYRVPSTISEVQAAIRPSLSHLSRQLGHKLWQATSFRATLILVAVAIAIVGIVAARRAPLSEREFTAGMTAVEQQDWDAAIEHLSVAVANDPDNAEAHYQLARAYLEVDNAGAAMQEITVAIRLNDRPEYFAVAGDALLTTNSVGAARQSYEMAIDGGIEDVATLTGLGHACLKLADFDAAESALTRAIKLDPSAFKASSLRASLEFNRQN